jgi:uncharacterized protein YndB with AHSA1/START domain
MYEPTPLAAVDCHADGDRWTLVFVRDLPHPPEKVWAALTEPDQLPQWSPYTADRTLDTPGDATLTMVEDSDGEKLTGSVRRAEPPTLLEHLWGDDLLRWELTATAAGTRLTLHHTLDDRGWVPRVAAGWHLCLDIADRVLAGQSVEPIRGEDALEHGWGAVRDGYADKLGIAVEPDPPVAS